MSTVQQVLKMGCWTPVESIDEQTGNGWYAELKQADGSAFEVFFDKQSQGTVYWDSLGQHNVNNALAAIAAARHAGVPTKYAIEALGQFQSPKRRMEIRGKISGITVYDDFAHHPTAIKTTLAGLRAKTGDSRIIAVLEPRSNTMRLGIHRHTLGPALDAADAVLLYQPTGLDWNLGHITATLHTAQIFNDIDQLVMHIIKSTHSGDHILIMSNGAFGGIHEKLLEALQAKARDG